MPSRRNLQSTNRSVCSRCSGMRSVRPSGTRTTDSSSPCALLLSCDGEGASGDGRDRTTAGSRSLAGRLQRRCQAPLSPPMNDPDESRSIRPSGRSPHLLRWRLTTRTPRAVLHARLWFWTECLLDASRWFLPLAGTRRARDPAALHRFCHPSCLASTRPPCCHPRRTPAFAWLGRPGNPFDSSLRRSRSFESRAALDLSILRRRCRVRRCVPTPTHCVGCWTSTGPRSAFRRRSGSLPDAETSDEPASLPCSTEGP